MDQTPQPQAGLSRRTVLTRSAAGAGILLSGSIPGLFGAETALGRPRPGYGPLIDDPKGLLALPEGFTYELIAETGVTRLESGELTPGRIDGSVSFRGRDGTTRLITNHELGPGDEFPVPHIDGFVYDPAVPGGTTTIEVDEDGKRVREWVSLAGTSTNCAGGKSPWGTWLTCEETEGEEDETKPHGYVFEVDPWRQDLNRNPKPLKFLGRFAHESVAVDPHTHVIYQTEDASEPNGLLYRWTPPADAPRFDRGVLRTLADDAGELDALYAVDEHGDHVPDLSVVTQVGTRLEVEWRTVPDRDAATTSTRMQFADDQITRSRKLEGMWWGQGGAYFTASYARFEDGSAAQHDGQVWHLDPDEGTLELKLYFVYTPSDQDSDADGPDNITVSAYGGLIIAEDGEGKQHLIGSTPSGESFFFARNDHADSAEFTGPNFSPDKSILFANVQEPGFVYAIKGPWRRQR